MIVLDTVNRRWWLKVRISKIQWLLLESYNVLQRLGKDTSRFTAFFFGISKIQKQRYQWRILRIAYSKKQSNLMVLSDTIRNTIPKYGQSKSLTIPRKEGADFYGFLIVRETHYDIHAVGVLAIPCSWCACSVALCDGDHVRRKSGLASAFE